MVHVYVPAPLRMRQEDDWFESSLRWILAKACLKTDKEINGLETKGGNCLTS